MLTLLIVSQTASGQEPSPAQFTRVLAPRVWQFPRDHGKHEEFQTEWWYYTGNLRSTEGREFGYQLTFFRNALLSDPPARASRWAFREGYVAHFTLTDIASKRFYYDQRMSRGALALAFAASESLAVNVGDWSATSEGSAMRLQAWSAFGSVALNLKPRHQPVLHGQNGFVQKAAQEGEASFYYSQPRLQTSGLIVIGADSFRVAGLSWMDHEFFSSPKSSTVAGWDWFSMQLSDSSAIMLYRLRHANGALSPFSAGTLTAANGSARTIPFKTFEAKPERWWRSATTGAQYPLAWKISFEDYELHVTAAIEAQELDTRSTTGVIYWEGVIKVMGTKRKHPLTGVGYLEMTGYAPSRANNASATR